MKKLFAVLFVFVMLFSFVSCDDIVGDKVGDALDVLGDEIGDAFEEAGEGLEDAADAVLGDDEKDDDDKEDE